MLFIFAYWEIGFFIYFLSFEYFGKLISLALMVAPIILHCYRKRLIRIYNTNDSKIEKKFDDYEEILIEKIEDCKYEYYDNKD